MTSNNSSYIYNKIRNNNNDEDGYINTSTRSEPQHHNHSFAPSAFMDFLESSCADELESMQVLTIENNWP
jgi:hypothetical protein